MRGEPVRGPRCRVSARCPGGLSGSPAGSGAAIAHQRSRDDASTHRSPAKQRQQDRPNTAESHTTKIVDFSCRDPEFLSFSGFPVVSVSFSGFRVAEVDGLGVALAGLLDVEVAMSGAQLRKPTTWRESEIARHATTRRSASLGSAIKHGNLQL